MTHEQAQKRFDTAHDCLMLAARYGEALRGGRWGSPHHRPYVRAISYQCRRAMRLLPVSPPRRKAK